MSSPVKTSNTLDRSGDRLGDRTEHGEGHHAATHNGEGHGHLGSSHHGLPMPGLSGRANSPTGLTKRLPPLLTTGNLLKGPVDEDGKLKNAALMVGIKLDLEAEVHLTARVRGDVLVGLY
ncbi:hypothetical protein GGR50DRAFT_690570 [Xylaria sp. CBS 124048]|nr:hypothetical protein GGR50DRAFT_690570 [Xylaria sp. CBS 124048]